MSRNLMALTVLGLFAVGCHEADPTSPMANGVGLTPQANTGPVVESVTGSGNFTDANGNFRTFAFSALGFADGSVSGQWERVNHVNESQTKSHGTVTCFTIEGNRARLGGFATSGLLSDPPNNEVGWRVADNGAGDGSPPDQISLQFVGGGPGFAAAYCDGVFGDIPPLNDVEAGNIQVRP